MSEKQKVLGIKQYAIMDGKAVELGKDLYVPLAIVQYAEAPPVLEQCGECSRAEAEEFAPQDCADLKNMRSMQISCLDGNDIWQGGACASFAAGTPVRRANPLRIIL